MKFLIAIINWFKGLFQKKVETESVFSVPREQIQKNKPNSNWAKIIQRVKSKAGAKRQAELPLHLRKIRHFGTFSPCLKFRHNGKFI